MASAPPKDAAPPANEPAEVNLAHALAELQRGEKTAAALESNLTSLEKKIDDLLASFERGELERVAGGKAEVERLDGKAGDEDEKKA
jgi:hypothetical protein